MHATISFPAGVPTITNSSTSLPISVGEQQLEFGESMPINHGAMIEVGPYILQAHSLSLDASPAVVHVSAPAPMAPMPAAAAVRVHTGMTVVLPPSVAAPAQIYAPPAVQPLATPLPASFSGMSDLSDLLGGTATTPVAPPPYFSAPAAPAAVPATGSFYATPAPSVAPPSGYIPPASENRDPFADLLDGIGGPPATPGNSSSSVSRHVSPPYIAQSPQTPSGLSADPLAAFGGSSGGSFGTSSGGHPPPRLAWVDQHRSVQVRVFLTPLIHSICPRMCRVMTLIRSQPCLASQGKVVARKPIRGSRLRLRLTRFSRTVHRLDRTHHCSGILLAVATTDRWKA